MAQFSQIIYFVASFVLYSCTSFFATVKYFHGFNIAPPSVFIVSVTATNYIMLNSTVTYGSDIRGKAEMFGHL